MTVDFKHRKSISVTWISLPSLNSLIYLKYTDAGFN